MAERVGPPVPVGHAPDQVRRVGCGHPGRGDNLRVLTTSRAPLGLSSESVYLLPKMDLPTTAELFEQRARPARPDADLPRRLCGSCA